MKKLLITSGILATGLYAAANEILYRSLIYRDFKMPAFLDKLISGDEESSGDKDAYYKDSKSFLEEYGYEKHYMVSERGHRLVAYHLKPKKESKIYIFCSHGYRSDGKGEWCPFVRYYVEKLGCNMFIVDHQCAGESEGKYIGFSSFESRDALKWLSYMNETFGKDTDIILHGISMGSATVMLMTGDENLPENVRFTIADCGFTSALDEFRYKLRCWGVPENIVVPLISAMNRARAGYDFQNDTNALEAVSRAKIPMLFIHGGKDKFVPTYMVHQLFDNCSSHYKAKLIVENAIHAESYYIDKESYEEKIEHFMQYTEVLTAEKMK